MSIAFMGLELDAASGVLVPRQETELLGWTAVNVLQAMDSSELRVVDVCCGSGNLACAIARAVPKARVWASDLTDDSVRLARRNVEKHALGDRIEVRQGDLFAPFAELEGGIDFIVCNPPYISSGKLAERHDLADEPREAFDGGPYGLTIHQRVMKEALPLLRAGGWLAFEFGLGQERQVRTLFERTRAYEAIELVKNEAGEPRVAMGRKS